IFAWLDAPHRKIAEHEPVPCPGGSVIKRAFDFDPLEGDARHAVLLSERIDVSFLTAVHAGSEESPPVGLDHLVLAKKNLYLVDRGFGRQVELTERAGLPRALGVDTDRFVAAAGPDFIDVRPVPPRRVQQSHLFVTEA